MRCVVCGAVLRRSGCRRGGGGEADAKRLPRRRRAADGGPACSRRHRRRDGKDIRRGGARVRRRVPGHGGSPDVWRRAAGERWQRALRVRQCAVEGRGRLAGCCARNKGPPLHRTRGRRAFRQLRRFPRRRSRALCRRGGGSVGRRRRRPERGASYGELGAGGAGVRGRAAIGRDPVGMSPRRKQASKSSVSATPRKLVICLY
mmetsp:Transcript_12803/g.37556  ORF Transcript_12803/g.37556 Transcript_12803/m.37556 type:complete len:203 (+) Transcript_12803:559-1167(+)